MKQILLLLTSVLLFGCTSIVSKYPVGTKALKISAEEWDGVWLADGGETLLIKVADEANGKLTLGLLDEDTEKGVFTLENIEATIREYNGSTYVNVLLDQSGEGEQMLKNEEIIKEAFYWFKIQKRNESIILWHNSDENFFEDALQKEELKIQKVKENTFLINEPSERFSEYLEKHKDTLYNSDNISSILHRVSQK